MSPDSRARRQPVDAAGKRFRVRCRVADRPGVPVLVSVLGPAAFRLAGEVADGALPFICPLGYLREQALPALRAGAAAAGRPPRRCSPTATSP